MEIKTNEEESENNAEITDKIIDDIVSNNKKEIFAPICGGLAYVKCEIADNKKCDVYLGEGLFVRTSFKRAKEIAGRKREANIKTKLTKLDDNTFEIVEHTNITSKDSQKKESEKNENKKEFDELYIKNKLRANELLNYKEDSKDVDKKGVELKVKSGREILKEMLEKQKRLNNKDKNKNIK